VFAEPWHEVRESCFVVDIGDDQRLLRFPDPAGGMAFDGRFHTRRFFSGDASFQNMKAHHVSDGIVKDTSKEVELDDGMKAAGKVVEKRGEIALLGDGLTDFEQGFELTPGMLKRRGEGDFGRGDDGIRHRGQDNTRVGRGSTVWRTSTIFSLCEA